MPITEIDHDKYGLVYKYPHPEGSGFAYVKVKHGLEKAAKIMASKWGFDSIGQDFEAQATGGRDKSVSGFLGAGGRLNPLGLADEVAALGQWAGANLPGSLSRNRGKSYSDLLKRQQAAQDIYSFANPKSSFLQRVAGGAAVGGPAAKAAEKGVQLSRGGLEYLKNIGMGTGVGAFSGAAEARGGFDLEGAFSRGLGAVEGALLGGIISGAIPVVTGAAMGIFNKVKTLVSKNPTSQESKKALLQLRDKLRDDGVDVDDAIAELTELGDEAVIADIAGANVIGTAKAAARQPGPAQQQAADILEQRQFGQGERVYGVAKGTMDVQGTFHQTLADKLAQMEKNASKHYPEAYKVELPFTNEMASFLKRTQPYIKSIWNRAQKIAKLQGRKLPEIIDENGKITEVPDMKTWDHIKRGLDEFLFKDKTNMSGKGLGNTERRLLKNIRRDFVDHLKTLNPKYRKALDSFAGDSGLLDAAEMGQDFLKIESDIAPDILKTLSTSEKEFFREGVIRKLRTIIYNAPDGADVVRKIFGSKALRERLKAIHPDSKSFKEFRKRMTAEAKMGKTKREVLGGSQTAELLAQQDALSQELGNWGIDLAQGNIGTVVTKATRALTAKKAPRISAAESQAMGDLYFTPGVAGNVDKLRQAEALANAQKLKLLGLDRGLSLTGAAVAPQEFKPLQGLLY